LKHLDSFNGQETIFKNTPVIGSSGIYQTQQKWNTGQLFQLMATTQTTNMYLYVFTVDALGKVHIHWPRKGQLNKKFSGKNESALVVEAQSKVTIHGPNKALRINQTGRDVLYLLFAKRKVKGLKFICNKMSQAGTDPLRELRQLMGKHLVPNADIQYGQNMATFKAETRSEGYIVPMVLMTESTTGK